MKKLQQAIYNHITNEYEQLRMAIIMHNPSLKAPKCLIWYTVRGVWREYRKLEKA